MIQRFTTLLFILPFLIAACSDSATTEQAATAETAEAQQAEPKNEVLDLPPKVERPLSPTPITHLAMDKPYNFITPVSEEYNKNAERAMLDGVTWKRDGVPLPHDTWLGYREDAFAIQIDSEEPMTLKRIALNCYQEPEAHIYWPARIDFAWSNDGENFEIIQRVSNTGMSNNTGVIKFTSKTPKEPIRYLRVAAYNRNAIPDGFPGAGTRPWTFVDEVIVK